MDEGGVKETPTTQSLISPYSISKSLGKGAVTGLAKTQEVSQAHFALAANGAVC